MTVKIEGVTIGIKFPREDYDYLKAEADKDGRSIANLIKRIIAIHRSSNEVREPSEYGRSKSMDRRLEAQGKPRPARESEAD